MKSKYSNIETFKRNIRKRSFASSLKLLLVLSFMLFIYSACDQSFNLIESLDGESVIISPEGTIPLTISPSSLGLYLNSTAEFTAIGGEPPYNFSILSGLGSITSSGVYTAPPTSSSAIIQVSDNKGDTNTAEINIADILTNIDYAVSLINDTSVTTIGGDPLSGSFTLTNIDVSDGSKTIYWDVFLSNDNIYSADDDLIDTGTTAQLIAGGSALINFSGFWPLTAGNYYFIVKTSALDDILDIGNNNGSSGAIAISGAPPDDIDYQINSVPAGGTTILTGSSISESFTIENTGSYNGSDDIFWTAYISLNNTLEVGTDIVVDSGNRSALTSGQISPGINFSGNWPLSTGTYYLLIAVSSGDDINTTNNISPSTSTYTVVSNPQISPSAVSLNTGGPYSFTASGGVLPYTYSINSSGSGTPTINPATGAYVAGNSAGTDIVRITDFEGNFSDSSITVSAVVSSVNYDSVTVINTGGTGGGTTLTGTFTFTNNGTGNGTQTVNWQVYTSLDNTIGAGDELIDSGTTSALNNGITSAPIPFSGTWPIPASDTTHYLIVQITATDDIITGDNSGNTSVLVTAPLSSDIDYIIQNITNSPSSADVSTPISQSFSFRNQGIDPGIFTVYWTAYFSSDQLLDVGDTYADSGSVSPLTGSTTSGSINITGNWPASSGNYYLIVKVSAGDDINPSNNYSPSAAFTINATATDIDYIVTNVSKNYPTVTSGSLISETFDLSNTGGLNGTIPISWTAYASLNTTLEIGPDIVIGSGTTPYSGLNSGTSYPFNNISGNWPAAGTYYLIIDIANPGDETITTNNTGVNGPFTVKDPPDYIISSSIFQIDGEAGTTLDALGGAFEFTIAENASSDGNQPISWEVFVSEDLILDGGDLSMKTGNIPALAANSTSGVISYADAVWPTFGNNYYLIINLSAGDDSNSSNNTSLSTVITVPEIYTEGIEDNSATGLTNIPLNQVSDVGTILENGTLDIKELVRVDGIMDGDSQFDTYKFVLSPGATSVDISVFWNTTTDAIDYYLWDENNNQWSSIDGINNKEQAPAFSGLSSNSTYYVGILFKGAVSGQSYTLEIKGN